MATSYALPSSFSLSIVTAYSSYSLSNGCKTKIEENKTLQVCSIDSDKHTAIAMDNKTLQVCSIDSDKHTVIAMDNKKD